MRRSRRLVLLGSFIVTLSVGFLSSPAGAQGGFKCDHTTYRWCGHYLCCTQYCAYCYNPNTGDIYSFVCDDPICWGMWV